MSLQQYYDNFRATLSHRSDPDPELCDCHGSGWHLSELDTWHECPCHRGLPHPEYDYVLDPPDPDDPVVAERMGTPIRLSQIQAEGDDIPF